MRTLKKSLALVLALVMVFSLAITASADFTDADEIAYPDEVELLVALDIMEGYPDGSFGAKKTLNRAEAAVIIARLNAFFDETAVTPSYTDMAGYGWANWAVAYAENAGIVNGTAEGIFEPATTLTGYMWVKMLLVSMGYDAVENGMVGAAWQVAVAKLDKSVGISGGAFDLSKEITREEAALFAYNALLATRDGQTWAVWHETSDGGHYHYFATEAEALAFMAATANTEGAWTGELIGSLGFEKHGLIGYDIGFGQWGEPFFGWETVNGFVTKDWIDPALEIYTCVTDGELFDLAMDAGLYYSEFENTEDYLDIFNLFVNGEYAGDYQAWKGLYNWEVPFSGNGTRLALYDAGRYGIIGVAVEQFIGQVVADMPAVEATGADAFVVIQNLCDDDDMDVPSHTIFGYEADLGDIVVYNVCAGEIVNIHTPNTVSGTVLRIDMKNTDKECDDVYDISGTEYVLSRHEGIESIEGAETAVWYVDDCGNLMLKVNNYAAVEYQVGFLLAYDAQNQWNGDKMHPDCADYDAYEKFTIQNIYTGEIAEYDGALTVTATDTIFAIGAKVSNLNNNFAADGLDLDATLYTESNGYVSLGLVVYLTNEAGEIFYISDKGAADGSLAVYTTEELIAVDPFDVNLYAGEAYAGLQLDNTQYVYATLETAHEVEAFATGIKNAEALEAVGEWIVDANGIVVAVAQYIPAPPAPPAAAPVVEDVLVYVSGDYAVIAREYWEVDEYGIVSGPKTEYVVYGLYVDGVEMSPITFVVDPALVAGQLYEATLTNGVLLTVGEAVEPTLFEVVYIGTGAAGDYFLTSDNYQFHMAADANIILVDDADLAIDAVNTSITEIDISFGKMIVCYVAFDASGLVTDLYYSISNILA